MAVCLFVPPFDYRKIVDRIDNDGDGFVTTEELRTWIKRVQKRYIYDNVAKVWKDYDRDKDDKISWEEYKQATYGYYLGKRCLRSKCVAEVSNKMPFIPSHSPLQGTSL